MVKQIVIIKTWSGVSEVYDPEFCEYEICSESVISFVVIQVSNTAHLQVWASILMATRLAKRG